MHWTVVLRGVAVCAFASAWLAASSACGSPIGLATAYSYSTPGASSPTIEGGAFSTIGPLGFFSPDGSGSFGGQANASFLSLATSAFGDATATHVCRCVQQGIEVIVHAISQDVLHPFGGGTSGIAGKLRITLSVSASNAAVLTGTAGSVPVFAVSLLNVWVFDPAQAGNSVGVTLPPNAGLAGFDRLLAAATNHLLVVDLPFRTGTPIGLRLQLVSRAQGSVVDGSFSVISDAGHTVSFVSAQLLDANGVPLANPSLTADSGTPYALVPEADLTAVLGIAGLFALGARRRT